MPVTQMANQIAIKSRPISGIGALIPLSRDQTARLIERERHHIARRVVFVPRQRDCRMITRYIRNERAVLGKEWAVQWVAGHVEQIIWTVVFAAAFCAYHQLAAIWATLVFVAIFHDIPASVAECEIIVAGWANIAFPTEVYQIIGIGPIAASVA